MYYKLIRKYYIEGYGFPKKYYSDADLDAFVEKGMITSDEAQAIKDEKTNTLK